MVKFQTYLELVDEWNSPSLNTAAGKKVPIKVTRYRSFSVSKYQVSSSYNSEKLLSEKTAHWNSSIELAYRKDGTAATCCPEPSMV